MSLSRRQFCNALGTAALATLARRAGAANPATPPLRVIAYNVLACTGFPNDRPRAKQAVARGQMAERLALELALYDPDVINFSESPSEAVAKEVAERLAMRHVRFPSAGSWPGTLLSRFEIVDSQNVPLDEERPSDLYTRHWGRATLKLPGAETLIVHSAHLHPSKHDVRLREIDSMLGAMKEDRDAARSMLLIGDLNHPPETEEYRRWIDFGWVDTFAKVGHGPGYTIRSDTPRKRIDYIMACGPIGERIAESRPLHEGAFRVDVADPESFALSDHLPQYARFGAAGE